MYRTVDAAHALSRMYIFCVIGVLGAVTKITLAVQTGEDGGLRVFQLRRRSQGRLGLSKQEQVEEYQAAAIGGRLIIGGVGQ